jgi:hypothetical protein
MPMINYDYSMIANQAYNTTTTIPTFYFGFRLYIQTIFQLGHITIDIALLDIDNTVI